MSGQTLVIRFGSMGDVVLAGAVTGALAPVTFVTKPAWAALAAALPGVTQVARWGQDTVARTGWKAIVDLHASPRSRALCAGLRGPVRRVARHDLQRRLRVWLKRGAPPPSVVARYAAAAAVNPASAPWLPATDGQGPTVLCPGASHATKQWPAEHWRALAAAVEGPVAVLGGPGDRRLCEAVAEAAGSRARVVAETGFTETLAILATARACVAGDTGLLHLAAAHGVPVVGLFGPTTSADGFWVWDGRGKALEQPLACRPCALHGGPRCPVGDHACMETLEVASVLRALRTVG